MKVRLTTVIKQSAAAFVVHHPGGLPEALPGMEAVLFRLAERLAPDFEHGAHDMDVHDLEAMLRDHLLDSAAFPELDRWNERELNFVDVEQVINQITVAVGEFELRARDQDAADRFFDPLDSNDRDDPDVRDFGTVCGRGGDDDDQHE